MKTQEEIINIIMNQIETDQYDFKEKYYSQDKKYDLIKDIVSLSNNIMPQDKYIIFGIQDKTYKVIGIEEKLPDISTIDDIIRMYVEPYLSVEIGSFYYGDKIVGYIKIPFQNLDRPYVIAKDYTKNNNTKLRKGEIYIRKGASNFLANRHDLDEIYSNKGYLLIKPLNDEIKIGFIRMDNEDVLMGQWRMILQNNSPKSVVLNNGQVLIGCGSNLIEHKVLFIDEPKSYFNKLGDLLDQKEVHLSSGECLQKTVYFEISNTAARNFYKKSSNKISAQLVMFDLFKNKNTCEMQPVTLSFANDLLLKWNI